MLGFDNFFTSYESTEAPPIRTPEYNNSRKDYGLLTGLLQFILDLLSGLSEALQNVFSSQFPVQNDVDPQIAPLQQDVPESSEQKTTDFTEFDKTALSIISMADTFVGGRYILGSANPNTKTFDCSGLTNYVFKQHGINIPRTTRALNKNGHRIDASQVRPGDLALFINKGKDHGHVGLVAAVNGDTFTMIDARGRKYGIVKRNLKMSAVTSFLRYIPDGQSTSGVQSLIYNAASGQGASTKIYKGVKDYSKKMYNVFYNELLKQGIDAAKYAPLLVAHTALESGWGKKAPGNNYGGIKGKYKGQGNVLNTHEADASGRRYAERSSFRAYPSVEEFAKDYITLLKNTFKAFDAGPENYITLIKNHKYFTAPLNEYARKFNSALRMVRNSLNG